MNGKKNQAQNLHTARHNLNKHIRKYDSHFFIINLTNHNSHYIFFFKFTSSKYIFAWGFQWGFSVISLFSLFLHICIVLTGDVNENVTL